MKFQFIAASRDKLGKRDGLRIYRRENPLGLTRNGLIRITERGLFGGIPIVGGLKMTRPNLNDKEIGHPLLTWKPVTKAEGATNDV
jgi:hypothetical protein